MATVEIVNGCEISCTVADMRVGDIGLVADGEMYARHFLVRIFEGLVSLKDPSVVWTNRQPHQLPPIRLERIYRAKSGTQVRMTL